MTAYLDNSATTKPGEACVQAVTELLTVDFGNPSSLHGEGIKAHRRLESARETIASSLGAEDKNEIYFTSGATEANNLAVLGAAWANRRKGERIVTTEIEHESVLESVNELEKQGFEVIRLKCDKHGRISEKALYDAINSDTILVSMMMVNNEVGSILPVSEIKKAVKAAGAPAYIHIDAVQAFGKVPVKVTKLGADLISVTAHKIHGPKGTGALYVRKGVLLRPNVFGGEQERKLRPGTEAISLIAGFEAAVKESMGAMSANAQTVKQINDYTVNRLSSIDGVTINSGDDALPYILNIAASGIRSQPLIQFLSSEGVYVSSGSACSKGKKSHVLTAMCLNDDTIDSSLRLSFSRGTTKEEIDLFIEALKKAQAFLVRR